MSTCKALKVLSEHGELEAVKLDGVTYQRDELALSNQTLEELGIEYLKTRDDVRSLECTRDGVVFHYADGSKSHRIDTGGTGVGTVHDDMPWPKLSCALFLRLKDGETVTIVNPKCTKRVAVPCGPEYTDLTGTNLKFRRLFGNSDSLVLSAPADDVTLLAPHKIAAIRDLFTQHLKDTGHE